VEVLSVEQATKQQVHVGFSEEDYEESSVGRVDADKVEHFPY
jgi:hypothetical protein